MPFYRPFRSLFAGPRQKQRFNHNELISTSTSSGNSCDISFNNVQSCKHESQWTAMLLFCIFSIVMGTSFMGGYYFRVTTSFKLAVAITTPPSKFTSQRSISNAVDFNSTRTDDNISNVNKQIDLFHNEKMSSEDIYDLFCIFCIYVMKLLGMVYFSFAIGDKYGRRKTLFVCSILACIAVTIEWVTELAAQACTNKVAFKCIVPTLFSQAVLGFQSGICIVVAPTLLLELAPKDLRGSCGAFFELFYVLGSTTSLFVDTFYVHEPRKFHLIFSYFVYIIQVVLLMFVCESPRWLFSKGRDEEAIEVLKKLRGTTDDAYIEQEIDEFKNREKPMPRGRFVLLVLVGAALGIGYLMTGRDVIDYIGTLGINDLVIVGSYTPIIFALCYMAISLLAILCNIFLADLIGRRCLVFTGLMFMTGALVALAHIRLLYPGNRVTLPGICAIVYIAAFSIGPGPMSSFVTAEMFGQTSRLQAVSFSQSISFAVFVAWRFWSEFGDLDILEQSPYGLAAVFVLVCLAILPFLYIYLPETKGGSLESVSTEIVLRKQVVVPEKLAAIVDSACTKPNDDNLGSIIVSQIDSPTSSSSSQSNRKFNAENNNSTAFDASAYLLLGRRRSSAPVLSSMLLARSKSNCRPVPPQICINNHTMSNDDDNGIEVIYDSSPCIETIYDSSQDI